MKISGQSALLALARAADAESKAEEQDWTRAMLRALAKLAPNACIDPDVWAPRTGRGRAAKEFLWDLTISSWPRYEEQAYEFPTYFKQASANTLRPPRLLLVAESEWGDSRGRRKNGLAVMEDFAKLLAAQAPVKVMIFGYFPTGASSSFKELSGLMVDLIRASRDSAEYVLFGVAWGKNCKWRGQHVKERCVHEEMVGP